MVIAAGLRSHKKKIEKQLYPRLLLLLAESLPPPQIVASDKNDFLLTLTNNKNQMYNTHDKKSMATTCQNTNDRTPTNYCKIKNTKNVNMKK